MTKSLVLRGIRWTLATSVLRRILALGAFYFIASWLTKEDLGVFREYTLILGFLTGISLLSLDHLYIVETGKKHLILRVMMQTTLAAALAGFIVLTWFGSSIGRYYSSPELGRILSYTAIFIVTEVIRRAARAIALNNKQFREVALAETFNVTLSSVLSVLFLYQSRSPLTYVIAFYLGNVLETACLVRLNGKEFTYHLTQTFKLQRLTINIFGKFRSFLSQATLVTAINMLSGNAPILILGLYVLPSELGIYFFATQLIGVPVGMFSSAVNQVLFPSFSGHDDGLIIASIRRYLRMAGSLGLPLIFLFTFIILHLIHSIFAGKWDEAALFLPLMAILYGSSLYCNPIGGIPFIRKKPGWELIWNIASLTIKTAAMFWGLQHSFYTAILAFALSGTAANFAFYLMSMHLLGQDLAKALRNLLLSLIPAVALSAAMLLTARLSTVYAIVVSTLLCMIIIVIADRLSKGRLREDVRSALGMR